MYVSPAAALRRLLDLHGKSIRSVRIEHGAAKRAVTTGTRIEVLDAKRRTLATTLGFTLPTRTIELILHEHYKRVARQETPDGNVAVFLVQDYGGHTISHGRD